MADIAVTLMSRSTILQVLNDADYDPAMNFLQMMCDNDSAA